MKWCYGLVQEKDGLMLCEVYFKDKPFMYVPVNWKEVNEEDIKKVLKDIKQQIKYKKFLKKEDFK